MTAIRSILWLGSSKSLIDSGVADMPTFDITWIAHPRDTPPLASSPFDAAVFVADDASDTEDAVRRLCRTPHFPPLLVCLRKPDNARMRAVLAAGAADLTLLPPNGIGVEARDELAGRIEHLAEPLSWSGSRHRDFESKPSADSRGGNTGGAVIPGLVGTSRAMREVATLVKCAAESRATVLLAGETGTGKELIARALQQSGKRRQGPFLAINCAAFPESLLESELFGYVKGAFTGADRDKRGLFEAADGGTLFLDEVSEVSGPFQAKLLRVLQEREIRPVGGTRVRSVDVRLVAASNRNLKEDVASGRFREDLYYRLSVFPISVPPLRQRAEDIVPLAEHFLVLHGEREGKPGCRLGLETTHLLLAHDWPGNVRELENEMQRALALAVPGELLEPRRLSERIRQEGQRLAAHTRPGDSLRAMSDRFQAYVIRKVLAANDGRRAKTARQLGLTREGLYKKMKRLGVE